MAIPTTTRQVPAIPTPHHWTREQYERVIEAGVFAPSDHVELLLGEITDKMSPQNSPHSAAIGAMQDALDEAFPREHWIRVQLPLAVSEDSQPEPDLAVVLGSWRDYTQAHPTTAVLVVEISDTTLAIDRGVKASIYAMAGIPEYWIVNIGNRMVEVHRQPSSTAANPVGYEYQSITRMSEIASLSPLASPNTLIQIANLLP